MIDAVGVVVPVHDEAARLPRCLAALDRAFAALPAAIRRCGVVVLDACGDGSEAIAAAWGHHLAVEARNVGAARAAGMRYVLAQLDTPRERTWLATTDADSEVPEDWLLEHVRCARAGAEAIAGTVRVSDWSEYPAGFGERFTTFYDELGTDEHHGHVHGANLGVRADAYLAAGGFAALATGEDHALWRALDARARVSSRHIAVTTSARREARAPAGFSGFLRDLCKAT